MNNMERIEIAANRLVIYILMAMLFAPIAGLPAAVSIWIASGLANFDVSASQCYAAGWLICVVLLIADMRQGTQFVVQRPEEVPDGQILN